MCLHVWLKFQTSDSWTCLLKSSVSDSIRICRQDQHKMQYCTWPLSHAVKYFRMARSTATEKHTTVNRRRERQKTRRGQSSQTGGTTTPRRRGSRRRSAGGAAGGSTSGATTASSRTSSSDSSGKREITWQCRLLESQRVRFHATSSRKICTSGCYTPLSLVQTDMR